jgi:hypothetical protein
MPPPVDQLPNNSNSFTSALNGNPNNLTVVQAQDRIAAGIKQMSPGSTTKLGPKRNSVNNNTNAASNSPTRSQRSGSKNLRRSATGHHGASPYSPESLMTRHQHLDITNTH